MSVPKYRADRTVKLLDDLEHRIAGRKVTLHIQVMGGAALLLQSLLNPSTKDLRTLCECSFGPEDHSAAGYQIRRVTPYEDHDIPSRRSRVERRAGRLFRGGKRRNC